MCNNKSSTHMDALNLADEGNYDAIIPLITNGMTDLNRIKCGGTLLMFATHDKQANIVRLLLEKGADPNIKDRDGYTALMICTMSPNPNLEIAKLLLDYGTKLNFQSAFGNTALIMATKKSSLEMVKLLVDCGANTSIQNMLGYQAIDYAQNNLTIKATIENAKNYGGPCRAVYCADGPIPLTRPVQLDAGRHCFLVWANNCWQPRIYHGPRTIVQLSVNPNDKIEYHVMLIHGEEIYVKFSEYLIKKVYRCNLTM